MYSLLKCNNALNVKRKYIANGEKLSRVILQKYFSFYSPASSNFSTGIIVTSNCVLPTYPDSVTVRSVLVTNNINHSFVRHLQTGATYRYAVEPGKASSKVEETVTALKEKALEQKKVKEKAGTPATQEAADTALAKPKKSLKQRVKDELMHYYHGFKLLAVDIQVSTRLVLRLLKGYPLTRREHKLLVRTVGDVFRLVPFSVFIIVPFMEFALPLFIKFFPGMLPSQFETAQEKDDKLKRSLKVKLEMAKFLQRTLDEMAVSSAGHSSEAAKEFAQFFEKVRKSGHMISSEDIMKFSKLFEDEITLDSLPRPQLMALCRVLEMNPIGTTNFLRFQLRLKLRSLAADDMMIHLEGVDSLSQAELQSACRARGMRALGVSEERLKAQLKQWLDLSLVKKVPPSLLLLSQAFMLPETTPTEEKLAATIQALPDAVGTATKAVIGEREGKVDFKTKIDIIKEEEAMIKEERMEELEDQAKLKAKEAMEKEKRAEEILTDTAPIITDRATTVDPTLRAAVEENRDSSAPGKLVSDEVTTKDIEALESAIDCLGKSQKKLIVEKEELQELREEMKEYQEDVADLQKLMMEVGKEVDVKETKAAQRLFRKVNSMITKIDSVLNELETKQVADKKKDDKAIAEGTLGNLGTGVTAAEAAKAESTESGAVTKTGDETLRIDDLIATVRKLHSKEDLSRLERIKEILSKMDADHDGAVRVDVVLKMLDLVGHENVKLNKKQVDELIALIDKEEVLVQESERKKDEEKAAAAAAAGTAIASESVISTLNAVEPASCSLGATESAAVAATSSIESAVAAPVAVELALATVAFTSAAKRLAATEKPVAATGPTALVEGIVSTENPSSSKSSATDSKSKATSDYTTASATKYVTALKSIDESKPTDLKNSPGISSIKPSSRKLHSENSSKQTTIEPTVTTTCTNQTMEIESNEKNNKFDPLTTITTATIQTPSKSTNTHKSLAEPTPGSVTPKNLR